MLEAQIPPSDTREGIHRTMRPFIPFKRWSLKPGRQEAELIALIQQEIVPVYRKLPGCLRIGLLRIEGTASYLTTQHWESRAARETSLASPAYQGWLDAYQPALERWDDLMSFEDEWDTEDLLDENVQ